MEAYASFFLPPSPRDAVHLFVLAASLRDYDRNGGATTARGNGVDARLTPGSDPEAHPITLEHLAESFRQLFRQGTS